MAEDNSTACDSPSFSSDWENLSSRLSSLSVSDDEDDGWAIVKNRKPKQEDQDNQGDDDSDSDSDSDMYRFYEAEESEGESAVFMKELLSTILPEIAANDRFSLDYIEQHEFPHLPAQTLLLLLQPASARWTKWISSPFFIHTHSLTYRTLSGFFFHNISGSPSFTSFDRESCSLPDPSLSFFPEPVLVKASNHGLICCLGRNTLNYYVCNPITAQWTVLPSTIDDHGPDTAVVIVMQEPLTYNFNSEYFVVCAYEIFEGVYGFETFSSEKWEWRKSNEIVAAEKIVSGSGTAVSGAAYWRTTMQRVVAFDPAADASQEIMLLHVSSATRHWEIGELGRKLCVMIVGSFAAEVRVWENGSDWKKIGEIAVNYSIFDEVSVVPLRTQGQREVALWDGGKRTITARDMERPVTERTLEDSDPGYCADFLPYVSSLVRVKSG